MKKLGYAFWLAVLAGILMVTLANPGRAVSPGEGAGAQSQAVRNQATGTPTPSGPQGSRGNPAKIGETLPIVASAPGGAAIEFDVTITEVITGQEALNRLRQADPQNEPPPEGQEYVLFFSRAQVTETSTTEPVTIGDSDWSLVTPAGDIFRPASAAVPQPAFAGEASQGATIEGWAVFTRRIGEPVSLVFGLVKPEGTGGLWFAVPGQ